MDLYADLKLPVLYNGDVPVGFTMTENEADAICYKNHALQWENKRCIGEVEYSCDHMDFVCKFMIKKKEVMLILMTINF